MKQKRVAGLAARKKSSLRTVQGEAAREILGSWPHHPTKTLARMLAEKEPALFKDVENTRRLLRYYRGNSGNEHRRQLASREYVRPAGSVRDGGLEVPPAWDKLQPWSVVPLTFDRALIMSDLHVPFHDPAAVGLALREGKRRRVDCVILNGDVADFYGCSFWVRDPRERPLAEELETTKRLLEVLRETFPMARIVYKEGNHEERLWRYVWQRAPDLAGVKGADGKSLVSLATVLDFAEYGVELVDNKRPILAGEHLHVLHGHEFRAPFQNPVNPARGLFLRAKANALCGDLHQSSSHTETGLGNPISCFSVGCLCDLHPHYMPLNKWNLGFAVLELAGKAWSLDNLKIIGGVVVRA